MTEPDDRRRGRAREVLGTGLAAVTTALLVAVIALACATQVVPRAMGGTSLTVLTGSMEPTFDPGDVIAVAKVDPRTVKVGDVVTFQPVSDDPTLITHRVVAKGVAPDGTLRFTTRGDANGADDDPIVAAQVKARYLYRLPNLGHVVGPLDGRGPLVATAIAIGLIAYGIWCFVPRPRGRRGRRGRGGRRRAEQGVAVMVLALAASTGAAARPAPARADGVDVQFAGPTVQLDWRGEVVSTTEPSFFGTRTITPGDRIARRARVSNTYTTAGLLDVDLTNVRGQGSLPDDVTLGWRVDDAAPQSRTLAGLAADTPIIDDVVVAPGASVVVTLQLDYPFASTTAPRVQNEGAPSLLAFDVTYRLREASPGAVAGEEEGAGGTGEVGGADGSLPGTGAGVEPWQVALGVLGVLGGLVLVAVSRRRDDETDGTA